MRTLLCLLAITATTSADTNQPANTITDLTGRWDVRWASAVRVNRNGPVEIQKWGEALLVFEQDGESVTGTWTTNVPETVTWRLEGTFREGRLRLGSLGHDSDNPELDIVEGLAWQATYTDDRLEGHVSLRIRAR